MTWLAFIVALMLSACGARMDVYTDAGLSSDVHHGCDFDADIASVTPEDVRAAECSGCMAGAAFVGINVCGQEVFERRCSDIAASAFCDGGAPPPTIP